MAFKQFALWTLVWLLCNETSEASEFWGGLSLSAGQGTAAVSTESSPPKIGVYSVHATIGFGAFNFFLFGARSSFSIIDQTSEVGTLGNRRGTRTNPISPVLGFDAKYVRLLFEYQFTGDYVLSQNTSTSTQLKYTAPDGFGVELIFNLKSWLGVGIRYEDVSFGKEQNGAGSPLDLPTKLGLQNTGVIIDAHF